MTTAQTKTSVQANNLGFLSLEPPHRARPTSHGQANSLGITQTNDFRTSRHNVSAGKANDLGLIVTYKRHAGQPGNKVLSNPGPAMLASAPGPQAFAAGAARPTFEHFDGAAYDAHGPNSAGARSEARARRAARAPTLPPAPAAEDAADAAHVEA